MGLGNFGKVDTIRKGGYNGLGENGVVLGPGRLDTENSGLSRTIFNRALSTAEISLSIIE